jgi:hypothetical protein
MRVDEGDDDEPGLLEVGPQVDSVHLGSLGSDASQRALASIDPDGSSPPTHSSETEPLTSVASTGQCPYSGHGNSHALEFCFWRRPKLRQWWLKGETTVSTQTRGMRRAMCHMVGGRSSLSLTKEHRVATMNDGMLDLVFVVLLVKMGAVLRYNLIANPTASAYPVRRVSRGTVCNLCPW